MNEHTSRRNDAPERVIAQLAAAARAAAQVLARAESARKDKALRAAAATIRDSTAAIVEANRLDLDRAKSLTAAGQDRLRLDPKRIGGIAEGLEAIAGLPDPIGREDQAWTRPNGLAISRVRVPLGVIGIIYESRPNVTADAGGLCLKSGNAAILRGGSESVESSRAIERCLHAGLAAAGLPQAAIQLVPSQDRALVGAMLTAQGAIDVIVPRGGRSLIERVLVESRLPVIGHLEGICHVYVDRAAELEMARRIVLNAKLRRTGVCGAAETLLVDAACASTHLRPILEDLFAGGCEVRGDAQTQAADPRVRPATEQDWRTEYLDAIISVRVVGGVEAAIEHIETYGSHHTDAIVTDDGATAGRFLAGVDSAIVLHNASTQFADGGEFGFGGEIGISTSKLHVRGPVGAEHLTSYKYLVRGTGQIRP
jgi:glutamate-5-semialdehyde dehydrogenase